MTESSQSVQVNQPYGHDASNEAIRDAFTQGRFPLAVYGLGKMGLPLAAVFSEVTGNVTGVDVDPDVVDTVNAGECHVKGEPGLAALTRELVSANAFRASTDPREAAATASIHVVIVPTPITDENAPDLSILDDVIEDIASGLSQGDFVIIECTVPPKTTADRVRPTLEASSGLAIGEFGLAFCPERTSSGRALEDIRGSYPKVVGGVDRESTAVATAIYEEINAKGVLAVSDATTAEAVKVFEGLYRDVNIALANELATFTDELGIDVREAIEVANTQPFCNLHEPGPGVGGHCIPFYPYFIIEPFETDSPLLQTARQVNDAMPRYTVRKLQEEFDAEGMEMESARVVILGLTYRPGVEEIRASPAIPIAAALSSLGAEVYGIDPMLEDVAAFDLERLSIGDLYEQPFDVIVSVTPHEEFDAIVWENIERENGELVVIDGRDTLSLAETQHRVYTIGSGVKK